MVGCYTSIPYIHPPYIYLIVCHDGFARRGLGHFADRPKQTCVALEEPQRMTVVD